MALDASLPNPSHAPDSPDAMLAIARSVLDQTQAPWSDEPMFPLGSLRFQPGDDVLCLLCTSGGNMSTAGEVLSVVMRAAALQGATVWVQLFDTERKDGVQPATPELLERALACALPGNGGTSLTVVAETLDRLPLPNGRTPVHLVMAFNGMAEAINAPSLGERRLPTTLVLPPGSSDKDQQSARQWWRASDVPVLFLGNAWLDTLDVLVEQAQLRKVLEDDALWTTATIPSSRVGRGRL